MVFGSDALSTQTCVVHCATFTALLVDIIVVLDCYIALTGLLKTVLRPSIRKLLWVPCLKGDVAVLSVVETC